MTFFWHTFEKFSVVLPNFQIPRRSKSGLFSYRKNATFVKYSFSAVYER